MYHILRGSLSGLKICLTVLLPGFALLQIVVSKVKAIPSILFIPQFVITQNLVKRIVRRFNAIAKCGTSTRATNCVNAIYGIKSMDYSLYFLYHILR